MPIDASIPLQVQPLKIPTAQEVMSLRDLATRSQINEVTLQEKQMELGKRNALLQLMQDPQVSDPQTGRLTPQGIARISQIDPEKGIALAHQQQTLNLQDIAVNEKRDAIKKRIGTSYVSAYQNYLQTNGGNTQEAERLARADTLKAIDEGESSGSFAAEGLTKSHIDRMRQLPPPEQMRTLVTAMGGSIAKPEAVSPIGKLNLDYKAGRISEKDYNEAKANIVAGDISPENKEFWADIIRKGGSLPPGLARSREGAKLVKEVMKEVPKGGTSAADVIANKAELTGITAGQRTLGTRTAQIEMAVTEAQNMAPLALQASNKVDRTSYPTLNSLLLAAEKGTGDENVVRLGVATNSLINIYARAINPTGVATVSDKDHARELLAAAWSKGQYAAGVDQLMKELAAARKSPAQVRGAMREALTGKNPTEEPKGNAPQAALDYLKAHPDSADHFKAKYGYLP